LVPINSEKNVGYNPYFSALTLYFFGGRSQFGNLLFLSLESRS